MDEISVTPLVLVHCGWSGDRELACRTLAGLEIACRIVDGVAEVRGLIAEDRVDLVLADAAGGHGPLSGLLDAIDAHPEGRELPMILLADAMDAPLLGDLIARRYHATLLAKPVARAQFEAAIRSGLRYWAGRRENRRLMAELEASHRRYHDLVHNTDAIVWEAEAATGRLTFVSRRAEDWFGGPSGRWEGVADAWLESVILDDREYAREARRHGTADGRDFELEYRAARADGRTVWLHEAARVTRDADGRPVGLRGLVRDITRRKKAERKLYRAKAALSEQLADMSHLHAMGAELSVAPTPETTQGEVLRAVLGVFGAEMGVLRLLDADRGELAIAACVGLAEAYRHRFGRVPVGETACGRAVARGETVVVEDTGADPAGGADREASAMGGFRAICCTPMVGRGGEPMGTVAAMFREPHRPPDRLLRLVELHARQAAGFVEAARLHAELHLADRRKDEFLAMLAHELRNPLAAVDGATRVAAATESREDLAWALEVIGRQSRQLARLVDDLLDASRIARGKIELRPERVDAAAVLGAAAEAARGPIEARGHRFEVDLGREALWLDADPARLEQIVVNLLTNAARYTPDGGHIRLGAGRRGDRVRIRVVDDGIGIRPEELPRLFGLFVQGERPPDRSGGGLGVGLALVKALTEMHGGSISASSGGPGRGSEFVVDLPAAAGPPTPAGSRPDRQSPRERRPAHVLVVDDSGEAAQPG